MLHVGAGCRLDECIVKRGAFERNIHLRQRDRRAEGDEEAAQFACLFFLTIQHELNQRTVGDEVAVQIIALDMLEMLQAIADGVRQRTVIAVIRHQRNQTGGENDASRTHLHRRTGFMALNLGERFATEFQNGVIACPRQAHADGGHMIERFAQLIAALREMADTMELAEFYDAVCEQTSYVRTLQEKGDVESRGRLENVQELKSNIVSFLENDPEDATLSGFLNEIALYTDLDSATSDNCVTMMTMHSAKGLEFPCVYVVGVEEGIFPGERVRYNDEEVEEERRLCYVAMTRAKERLTMTCTRQRMLFGRTSVSEPSRFLEEVPSENADWVGRQAQGASGFGDTSFDEGSSYSTRGYGSYGQGAARYDSVMQRRPKSQASQKLAAQKPAASAPLLQLSSGDQIHHKTFGDGLVISVTPMGGDALLEVAFDTVGTKKLMLKTAGVHITKL